jgi:hypothetical protein
MRSKIRDDGVLIQLLTFGYYLSPCFYIKHRFGYWDLCLSLRRKYIVLGPIARASHCRFLS